jgi:hypothetical protein
MNIKTCARYEWDTMGQSKPQPPHGSEHADADAQATDAQATDAQAAAAAAAAASNEWEKRTALWSSMTPQGMELPKGFDINDPKFRDQIKVEIGPPMSAEQFKAWQETRRQMMQK